MCTSSKTLKCFELTIQNKNMRLSYVEFIFEICHNYISVFGKSLLWYELYKKAQYTKIEFHTIEYILFF